GEACRICSRGSSTRVKRTRRRRRRRKTRTPTTSRTTTSTRTTTRTSTTMTMIGTTTTTTTTKRRKGRRRLAPRGAESADGVRGARRMPRGCLSAGREAPEHWTGPRGRYLERGALRPRHRHARDLERRRRDRGARTEVAPHHLDVAQHVA